MGDHGESSRVDDSASSSEYTPIVRFRIRPSVVQNFPQATRFNLEVARYALSIPFDDTDIWDAESDCNCRCHRRCCAVERVDSSRDDANYETEWLWDSASAGEGTEISGRDVTFHKHFSNGTAAIRGEMPLKNGQHYWEIKMITSVYGTDMMVGCGTANVDLKRFATKFVSLLGLDSESWGLSYSGLFVHNGVKRSICKSFGEGMVIGIHLDMWHGKLSFYRNGKFIGLGFSNGIRGKEIYPMVCSTAARTGMRIVRSSSFPTSLQFMCCQVLRQCIPADQDVTKVLNIPPGLKLFLLNNLDWLLRPYSAEETNKTVCKMRKRGVSCVREDEPLKVDAVRKRFKRDDVQMQPENEDEPASSSQCDTKT